MFFTSVIFIFDFYLFSFVWIGKFDWNFCCLSKAEETLWKENKKFKILLNNCIDWCILYFFLNLQIENLSRNSEKFQKTQFLKFILYVFCCVFVLTFAFLLLFFPFLKKSAELTSKISCKKSLINSDKLCAQLLNFSQNKKEFWGSVWWYLSSSGLNKAL